MTIEEIRALLEKSLPPKRYQHSMRVYETALTLGKRHHAEEAKVALAALLHDCGREIPVKESVEKARALGLPVDFIEAGQPVLLHAKIGAYLATQKYGVTDPEVLEAIRCHTTGAETLSLTARIVFLADMLEPGRRFPGVEELRRLAREDLEQAMFTAYRDTICYLLEAGALIHPAAIAGYNRLAVQRKNTDKLSSDDGNKKK
ncbi:MAG: bis(5'-nucleosyl)-tetraphosphatase (symmetrical) YqeK [Succiniclasticum sp.]|nr:bis(5'-nucleosyl)-tetraphosphatase (symmetrical) YqeK [Succiniclasticum sp.]MDY6087184.1 bis(5'-nucleosyl)-tetraphosphatase (symmetrical) YqeK [Succiniclasticum sp.]